MTRIFMAFFCLLGIVFGLAAAPSAKTRTNQRFDPASVVTSVDAIYPLQSVVSGTVLLELSLNKAGKIVDIRVVKGFASLTEPAEQCVRQWSFQPSKLDGKPVSSKIVVAFSFVPPNVGPRDQLILERRPYI